MIGQTISHYKITAKLGSGGMGEVYLAVDSKLDRKVALKFLPPSMSAQADAKARFLQEARAASALNHPNVCTIYDIQEHEGRMFIVMEYVEGQTLRDRAQPFTLKQIIEIGIQVADGLAAAHEKGIVHRDIKTENIMIRKDGIVQIMDFGLAKLRGASRLTKEGSTIGTVGYMSPEQVQGLETDHRTDLFSLGVVLYELIAGEQPFKGVHETAIMYEIVNVDAQPLSAVRPDVDPDLDRIILDCLQKDPEERSQSAKEVARDLRRFKVDSGRRRVSRVSTIRPAYTTSELATPAVTTPPTSSPTVTTQATKKLASPVPWAICGALLLAVLALGAMQFRAKPAADVRTMRFTIPVPEQNSLTGAAEGTLALSPDGRLLAFVATDSLQTTHLWMRPFDALAADRLPGTEDATYPFWSPDSRYVGFFAGGKLKKIDVTGGPPITLCEASSGRGGTWNPDGVIVLAATPNGGLSRVAAAGGVPVAITHLDSTRHESSHRWPWFLPDGNHFLYYDRIGAGASTTDDDSIHFGSLDGSVNRTLMQCGANVAFARRHLIFPSERTLMAQPFDPQKGATTGDPFPIAEDVYIELSTNDAVFTVSESGSLAYQTGAGGQGARPIWLDRSGHPIDTVAEVGDYRQCRLSPDGKRLAVNLVDPRSGSQDIWIFDLARRVKTRLTFGPAAAGSPRWSPDGSRIVYAAAKEGHVDLYQIASSGAGTEQALLKTDKSKTPLDWSLDGRFLVFYAEGAQGVGDDLWILPMAADGTAAGDPYTFLQTEFDEDDGQFSPDVRWMAYGCGESGRFEVYARPFPGPGGKWQISTEGGDYPLWRRDGKELFYLTPDNAVMAVDVTEKGGSLEVGAPRRLFQTHLAQGDFPYDVSADGQRFIALVTEQGKAATSINIVVNWDANTDRK